MRAAIRADGVRSRKGDARTARRAFARVFARLQSDVLVERNAVARADITDDVAFFEQNVDLVAHVFFRKAELRGEIAELRAQGESDRIDFRLQLAGVRNVKAARAILGDHGGDVDALKEAEPWLFADAPAKQSGGKTGLPNAGTSTDAGKTMRRWRKLAGLDDSNDNA